MIEECEAVVAGNGLCAKHYARMRRWGTVEDIDHRKLRPKSEDPCSVEGCDAVVIAKGMCRYHYNARIHLIGDFTDLGDGTHSFHLLIPMRYESTCIQCGKTSASRIENRLFCDRKCKTRYRTATGDGGKAARKSYFKNKYGMTTEEIDTFIAEGGCCAICRTTDWRGRHDRPVVDHCHSAGDVRGMLCSNCNVGLGYFGDDPERLMAAARYLERFLTSAPGRT